MLKNRVHLPLVFFGILKEVLYKHNSNYFKEAEKVLVKAYMIELTYRYVKTPLGQSLVENFTKNFDAVRNILE